MRNAFFQLGQYVDRRWMLKNSLLLTGAMGVRRAVRYLKQQFTSVPTITVLRLNICGNDQRSTRRESGFFV
jgi:hypothetical protein